MQFSGVYELVPEANQQKFRNYRKTDIETYVEFVHEKESMFDRWCAALKVKTFEELRELILLEDFKNCLPERVVTYINKQKVPNCSTAAALADDYLLIHKNVFSFTQKSSPISSSRRSQRRNFEVALSTDKRWRVPKPCLHLFVSIARNVDTLLQSVIC